MTVIRWTDNDAGYEAWRQSNPTGYVANIFKSTETKLNTRYLKIHRVSCKLPDRSNPNSVNPRTGNDYAKVSSEGLGELLIWLRSKGFEVGSNKYCLKCGPSDDVCQQESDLQREADERSSSEAPVVYPDEVAPDQRTFIEGAAKQVLVNQYERDSAARSACIQHWGSTCYVCGFDFHKTYGGMGQGFIHVHHLADIASIGKAYQVDPRRDLRPVCPNCHAMLHTQRPALDIDVLRSQLLARGNDADSD